MYYAVDNRISPRIKNHDATKQKIEETTTWVSQHTEERHMRVKTEDEVQKDKELLCLRPPGLPHHTKSPISERHISSYS